MGRAIAATLALFLAGCGGPGSPTADRVAVTRRWDGTVDARGSTCTAEIESIAASIWAEVTPALFLELRRGTCAAPGTLAAASSSGRFSQNVRAGAYHVVVLNTTGAATSFSLTVEYTKALD